MVLSNSESLRAAMHELDVQNAALRARIALLERAATALVEHCEKNPAGGVFSFSHLVFDLRAALDAAKEATGRAPGTCEDCGRRYGDRYGFPDLVVPHNIWNNHLSTRRDGSGLLCPSCMCRRAYDAGPEGVPAEFRSGPFCADAAKEAGDG